jgi:hypothetical protein
MMLKPELTAEMFRQLAFISALVGGFAFAFVGVLLVAPVQSRVVSWTAGISMAASSGLVVCALGWSLGASVVLVGASMEAGADKSSLSASLNIMHLRLSLAFIVSILLFLISLGLSGWIRSRNLGIVSTCIAVLAAISSLLVLSPFMSVT